MARQDERGDFYALGQTIIYDIIMPFIEETSRKSSHQDEIFNILNGIDPKESDEKIWYAKELKKIARENPYRVQYMEKTKKTGKLCRFPPDTTYQTSFIKIFDLLEGCLTNSAINALKKVANLACNMISSTLEKRLTGEQIKEKWRAGSEAYIQEASIEDKENAKLSTDSQDENMAKRKADDPFASPNKRYRFI